MATMRAMNDKDKALKVFLGAVAALAVAMFLYYWVAGRARTTQHDINVGEKVDGIKEEKSEFTGIYSASEPVEGGDRRLNFFTLSKKDDGSGFYGTAKVDKIASTEAAEEYMKCNEANVAEKDFFIKCSSPEAGQLSFVGEWSKGEGGVVLVPGKVLWAKDGNVLNDKQTTLSHTPGQ